MRERGASFGGKIDFFHKQSAIIKVDGPGLEGGAVALKKVGVAHMGLAPNATKMLETPDKCLVRLRSGVPPNSVDDIAVRVGK